MHVLSRKESRVLLSVLRGGEERELDSVGREFCQHFESRADRFRACCALVLLLQDEGILAPEERLFALFCILDAFEDEVQAGGKTTGHPFSEFLAKVGTDEGVAEGERELVFRSLVQNNRKEARRATASKFASLNDSLGEENRAEREAGFQKFLLNGRVQSSSRVNGDLSCFANSAVHRAVVDRKSKPVSLPTGSQAIPDLAEILASNLGVAGFEPAFARPFPVLLKPLLSEVHWINPSPARDLVWDCSVNSGKENLAAVKDLLQKALDGPLMPAQQKQVLQELLTDPKLAYSCGLTPESLPRLVENTPAIAYEILVRLINSSLINEYLQVLVRMNMSLHSMEVVNRLATAVDLPVEFIHCYISNCIASCNNVEDRYMQSRLVRLVCVFLQSLIKNGIINMEDLVHEVQAFCIDHSRIREAASLFRLLKQMEMENKGGEREVGK